MALATQHPWQAAHHSASRACKALWTQRQLGRSQLWHARLRRTCGRIGADGGSEGRSTGPAEQLWLRDTLSLNRRRLVTGLSVAAAAALGGNLGGLTSWLLSLDEGKLAHQTRIDVILPVLGFKRCYDAQLGYEFLYPASWLADQTLLRRAVSRAEQERSLDLPPVARSQSARRLTVEPATAFGPPNTSGEENISIIRAPLDAAIDLTSFGSPSEVARRLIETQVAPPMSGKTAQLITAFRKDESGQTYYIMEFTVQTASWRRHNVCILATRDSFLYTWNAQCPEAAWPATRDVLLHACDSFRLLPSGL